jgi:hypothetical protein
MPSPSQLPHFDNRDTTRFRAAPFPLAGGTADRTALIAQAPWIKHRKLGLLDLDDTAVVQPELPARHTNLATALAPNVNASGSEQEALELAFAQNHCAVSPSDLNLHQLDSLAQPGWVIPLELRLSFAATYRWSVRCESVPLLPSLHRAVQTSEGRNRGGPPYLRPDETPEICVISR